MGMRRGIKVMGLSCSPHTPFLKNIKVDLYCQLVSLPRLWNLLFHELLCAVLTHRLHTHLHAHTGSTHLRPGDHLLSALLWKSKAPQPSISASAPWALLLSTKFRSTSRVLYLKPLNSLMFGKSWESSSREGTTWEFNMCCVLLMLIGNTAFQAVDF